jgi:hypothetical protein
MTIPSMQQFNNSAASSPEYQRERFQQDRKFSQKVLAWTNERFEEMKAARASTERQWKLNLAFYFGRQHVIFKQGANFIPGQSGTLYVPPAPYYRARPVINRIRPIIRSEQSKLTSQKPSASIVPASNDDSDLFAARAGEQIWESLYRKKKISHTIRQWTWWALICGSGFCKVWWDANLEDNDSEQMGDFCFAAETPFHVFVPELRQPDLELQPYIIHAQIKSRAAAEMQYMRHFPSQGNKEAIIEENYLNLIGANNTDDKKSVICMEVWVKPNADSLFPQGAMFTLIGDVLVEGGDGWPYKHKQYPFAKLDHIPSGKFYGDSSIVDLIPIQRELNRTRGQIIDAKNRMAKPQLLAPAGSIDPRKITTEPGLVIEYAPGFNPPQPIPLSPLPNYVLQEVDRLLMDFSDISGQHEVSRGQTPPGVTAATAISYLQEQDESMLSSTYDSLEEGVEKIAFQTLSLVAQYWNTPRMIKVVGDDGSFEVLSFKGANLRGNTDIRVEGGSALPTSKAAKQAFIMDLMKMGFIPPDKGLEVMEIGGINKIYDELQTDVRQAQRENLKMKYVTEDQLGEFIATTNQMMQVDPQLISNPQDGTAPMSTMPLIVPVNTWDNDAVHIEIHNKYRKSQAYDTAPQHVKELFDAHVKAHVDQKLRGQLAQVPPDILNQMQQAGDPMSQVAYKESQLNGQMQGGSNGTLPPQPGA